MKKFTLLILAALFAAVSWAQETPNGMQSFRTRTSASVTGSSINLERPAMIVSQSSVINRAPVQRANPGMVSVTLTAGDVWGDGSGYHLLLDPTATAYGTVIPLPGTPGGISSCAAITPNLYDIFTYRIPTNAIPSCSPSGNFVFNNSVTIEIPAGVYDYAITNPEVGNQLWIAGDYGNTPGRFDNFIFEEGKKYTFTALRFGNNDGINLLIEDDETATCPSPTDLAADNITQTSADISWVAGGTESSWIFQYKKALEINWVSATVTSTQMFLTNLDANTQYNVRIKAVCGTDDESIWRTVNFKTACGLYSIPFIEDFSGWATGSSNWSDPCWQRGAGSFVSGTTPFPYVTTLSSNNALYFGNSSTTFSAAFMPPFDAAGQNLALVFDLAMGANNRMDIIIATNPQDEATWLQIDTTISNGTGTAFANYKNYEVIIPNYQAGTYIGFKSYVGSGTTTLYAYLDNIFVTTCPQPKNLAVDNIMPNSVDFSFTQGGTATQWQYVVAPASVTDPATIVPTTITATSGTISGLESGKQYKLWVRSVCSATENSPWTGAVAFSVPCVPVTAFPFTEGFEGTIFPPDCWTVTNVSGSSLWGRHTSDSPRGTASASISWTSSGTGNNWLITPLVSVPAAGLEMSFWVKCPTYYSGTTLNVKVSDGTNAVADFSPTAELTLANAQFTTSWVQYTVNLAAYAGQQIYVGFQVVDNNGLRVMLDDVEFKEFLVDDVAATGITSSVGSGMGLTTTDIVVTVNNEGSAAQSNVPVVLEVNGAVFATQYVASIASGDTETVTFTGIDVSTLGTYAFRAYTNLTTDQNRANDTTAVLTIVNIQGCTNPLDVQIGNGTVALTTLPINNWFAYNYNQTIYLASEIEDEGGGAGPIVSIGYHWNGESSLASSDVWTVYIGNTDKTIFASTTDWVTLPNLQQVFTGTVTLPAGAGWMNIVLDNPFIWDGESNIVVAVLESVPGYTGTSSVRTRWYGTSGANRSIYINSDTSIPNPASPASGTRESSYPNIKFNMCPAIPPTCPKPTALTATNATVSDVELAWTAGGTESQWIVEYKKGNETNWTPVTVTTNPYILTGLDGSTSYNVRVKADCGAGDESNYSNVVNFNTACGAITTLPWVETFEANVFTFDCWKRYSGTTVSTTVPSTSTQTGSPSGPNTLYFGASDNRMAILPTFAMDINTLQITFWLRKESGNTGVFEVGYITDINDATTFVVVETFNESQVSTWLERDVVFSSVPAGVKNIAFRVMNGQSNYYYWVDDILVETIPTCPRPTALAVSNITASDAEITWTAGGFETAWELEYKKSSETNWTSIPTSIPSYVLSSLDDNTGYNVRVKAVCAVGDESNYSNIVNFRTDFGGCNAVSTPYYENFTGWATGSTVWSNPCWKRYNNGAVSTSNPYINASNYSSATNNSPSGTPYLYFSNSNATNPLTAVLPEFVNDANTMQVTFWALREGTSSGTISVGYLIDINDPNTSTNFVAVETFNPTAQTWFEYTVELNSVPAGIKNIAFRQNATSTAWYYWVDDILVENLPTCSRPVVTLGEKTATTATINWTGGNASSYVVEWGEAGFELGTGATATATGETYTIQGLEPLTSYDVYVYGDCGAGDLSRVVKVSFTTDYLSVIVVTPENPYLEDFENAAVSGSSVTMGNVRWSISNDIGNSIALSIRNDSRAIDGNYAYISKGVIGHVTSLISPLFDITALDLPAFSLQHIQWGYYSVTNRSEELRIYYRAAQEDNWTLIPGMEFTSIINDWETDTVVLPNPSATYQLRFEVTGRNAMGVGLDNVRIFEGAPRVVTLAADPVAINSAMLHSEVEKGIKPITAQGWEYKATSATTWQTTTNATITGLTHSTPYEFRAFATTEDKTYHGEILYFTTQTSSIETVFESSNVALYPNPAKSTTTLAIEGLTSTAQIVITDLTGRTIGSYTINATQTQLNIDVSGFADGTYLVRVITDKCNSIQKLVVKK